MNKKSRDKEINPIDGKVPVLSVTSPLAAKVIKKCLHDIQIDDCRLFVCSSVCIFSTYESLQYVAARVKVINCSQQISLRYVTPGVMTLCRLVTNSALARWPLFLRTHMGVASSDRKARFVAEYHISSIRYCSVCSKSTPIQTILPGWRVRSNFLNKRWAQGQPVMYGWHFLINCTHMNLQTAMLNRR